VCFCFVIGTLAEGIERSA